jgi:hypothetical protein
MMVLLMPGDLLMIFLDLSILGNMVKVISMNSYKDHIGNSVSGNKDKHCLASECFKLLPSLGDRHML